MAKYCSLFSGSSGNCTYLASPAGGILVDAGVSAKRIREALTARGVDPASLKAIFITHEHSDHIAGLKVLLKQFPMPVYATRGTLDALIEKDALPSGAQVCIMDGAVEAAGMTVSAFATPHDSVESCGYRIAFPDERTAAVATDMGYLTDSVAKAIAGCDLVHIESNHDVGMLECGPYPYALKRRVLGRGGHLSNEACASLLPSLLQSGTTRFMLSHLSKENNDPALAHRVSQTALESAGAVIGSDCLLAVAPPQNDRGITIF